MESAVSIGLSSLVRLLFSEMKLSNGVYEDIREIKDELETIQSLLKDADLKADLSYGVREWAIYVREIAYSIEDVIDEYILRVARNRHRNVIARFFYTIVHPTRKLKIRSGLVHDIQRIKESVREISEGNIRYGLINTLEERRRPLDVTEQPDPRVSNFSLFTEAEADVFMMESDRDKLISLMNEEGLSKRIVISVVGMGGLGKTTLAKNIYDIQIMTGRFDCYAWITASPSYKQEELLRSLINQFYKSTNKSLVTDQIISMDELVGKLGDYLKHKRYFVVFDDVWNTDFWTSIKHALPDTDNASRVIITTRNQNVALSCQESSLDCIHRLWLLPEDKAWELFCKKTFQSDFGGLCPPQLVDCSRIMVERCGGLPLAIAIIGGLLSMKKKSVSQWKVLSQSLTVNSESDHLLGGLSRILLLSFHDLPYNLKSCFLYLGIFPEDCSINCNRLVKLWIAEGFVKEKGGKTLEEVAYEYLAELICRNLVYVAEVKFDGKPRCCRVHYMMRDIIMLKSRDLSFCEVLLRHYSISVRKARRLSIQCDIDTALKNIGNSMTRSIFLFKVERLPNNFLAMVCADFKLLKVLDAQYAPLENLPKEVGDLFHLKYLSIRGTKINKLPKSICKLHNLQTLDLKFTRVQYLPVEIKMLKNLLYLLSYYNDGEIGPSFNSGRGVRIQSGIGCLQTLEKLYCVEANNEVLIGELGNLRLLRKLGITKLTAASCQALCSSIEKMIHLRSLSVHAITEIETMDLSSLSSPPPFVEHVNLCGRIAKLPHWIPMLTELVVLSLGWSGLKDDPLELLKPLKTLQRLWLRQAYEGDQLHFKTGWFSNLKVLGLTHLAGLNMLTIDEGAMPHLEELTIGPSQQLMEVPSGIQYLKKLTALQFFDMPRHFVVRTLPDGGLDFGKVQHISAVFFNRSEHEGYHTYTLSNSDKLKHSYQ